MKNDRNFSLKKLFGLFAVCLIAVVLVNVILRLTAPQYDLPPAVMIDGSVYQGSGSMAELPPDSVYLGEIVSSVPSSKGPTKNFQANDELTGAPVYRLETDKICVYSAHSNQWLTYYKLEE